MMTMMMIMIGRLYIETETETEIWERERFFSIFQATTFYVSFSLSLSQKWIKMWKWWWLNHTIWMTLNQITSCKRERESRDFLKNENFGKKTSTIFTFTPFLYSLSLSLKIYPKKMMMTMIMMMMIMMMIMDKR